MRTLSAIVFLVILILSSGCTTSGDNITSPVLPSLQNSENNINSDTYKCRAIMRTIAGQATIFFAVNNYYPSSLEEIGMAGVVCPTHNDEYVLIGTESEYYIECGLTQLPNHGNIDNGVPSWLSGHSEPGEWEDVCRANMRTIASQATIFFAGNDRYPKNLEEIGMAGVVCPECGEEYQLVGGVSQYLVHCPVAQLPNHGAIVNGIPSWHEDY